MGSDVAIGLGAAATGIGAQLRAVLDGLLERFQWRLIVFGLPQQSLVWLCGLN